MSEQANPDTPREGETFVPFNIDGPTPITPAPQPASFAERPTPSAPSSMNTSAPLAAIPVPRWDALDRSEAQNRNELYSSPYFAGSSERGPSYRGCAGIALGLAAFFVTLIFNGSFGGWLLTIMVIIGIGLSITALMGHREDDEPAAALAAGVLGVVINWSWLFFLILFFVLHAFRSSYLWLTKMATPAITVNLPLLMSKCLLCPTANQPLRSGSAVIATSRPTLIRRWQSR